MLKFKKHYVALLNYCKITLKYCIFIPNLIIAVMKKIILFLSLLCVSLVQMAQSDSTYFGVNLSGAEWDSYEQYPSISQLDYYKSKGIMLIRLPIKWERLQTTLSGEIDAIELQSLLHIVDAVASRNMKVLVDVHNYARYDATIIGEGPTIADAVDLWVKLATQLKSKTCIYGYDIMNEPHDMPSTIAWKNIAQAIITGIRTIDTSTTIFVEGDSWASAERWPTNSDNLKSLVDPSNNLVFEAHCYFDNNASGTYVNSYDADGVTINTGLNRVKPFVDWIKKNNLKGFLGEYGVPSDDPRWLTVLDTFLAYLKANKIGGTYWSGGAFDSGYSLSCEPDYLGNDAPQMALLEKYGSGVTSDSGQTNPKTFPEILPFNPWSGVTPNYELQDDASVTIPADYKAQPGDILTVKIAGTSNYNLSKLQAVFVDRRPTATPNPYFTVLSTFQDLGKPVKGVSFSYSTQVPITVAAAGAGPDYNTLILAGTSKDAILDSLVSDKNVTLSLSEFSITIDSSARGKIIMPLVYKSNYQRSFPDTLKSLPAVKVGDIVRVSISGTTNTDVSDLRVAIVDETVTAVNPYFTQLSNFVIFGNVTAGEPFTYTTYDTITIAPSKAGRTHTQDVVLLGTADNIIGLELTSLTASIVPQVVVPVTSVVFASPNYSITVSGSNAMVKAMVFPTTATYKTVTYSISNPSIATINPSTGVITPKANGTVVVTATSDDGLKTAYALVSISGQLVSRNTILATCENGQTSLSTYWYSYAAGLSTISQVSGEPFQMVKGGANGSDSAAIVTGRLVNPGDIIITPAIGASAYESAGIGFPLTNGKAFTVAQTKNKDSLAMAAPLDLTGATGISFYHKGDAISFSVLLTTVSPSRGYDFSYAVDAHTDWTLVTVPFTSLAQPGWMALNDQVMWNPTKVYQLQWLIKDGDPRSYSFGIDEVTLIGKTLTPAVPVTSVIITPPSYSITTPGALVTVKATVLPSTATNKAIVYSISNSAIATVNASTGIVTPKANGTVMVTATSQDGFKTATTKITISGQAAVISVTSVVFAFPSYSITTLGTSISVKASVLPSTATDKTVTYSCNSLCASVNSLTGVVTPISDGTAIVYATSRDGLKSAYTIVSITGQIYSQIGGADKAFINAWSAKHNKNNQYQGVVMDFTDSTIYHEWTKSPELEYSATNVYTPTWDATNKALKIHYKYTGTGKEDNYSGAVNIGKGITKKNDSLSYNSTSVFNPFLENDSIIAKEYIDMRDTTHRSIAVYCKLVNNDDSASLRFDIYDVNGRKTNFDNSSAKKGIKPSVGFQKIIYNWCYDSGANSDNVGGWNEDAPTFFDGYSGEFWGVNTGHWSPTATIGLPRVVNGSGAFQIPLESAYMIPKFSFSTNGGGKTDPWVKAMAAGTKDKEFDILIQKVEFGVPPFNGNNTIPVTGVVFTSPSYSISTAGAQIRVSATVTPYNATQPAVTYSISNGTIAFVDAYSGNVTPLANGTVTVYATSVDGSKTASAQIIITGQPVKVAVTAVVFDTLQYKITLPGKTLKVSAIILPYNASNKLITYRISNPSIASINTITGEISPLINGTVTVYATSIDGYKSATTTISISGQTYTEIPVSNVAFGKGGYTITYPGTPIIVRATVLPTTATNKAVTYSISNSSIASINEITGVVTPLANGTVSVYATSTNGEKIASTTIAISGQPGFDDATPWSVKHNKNNQRQFVTMDFTNATLYNEWSKNPETEMSPTNVYTTTWDATEKALKIHYSFTGDGKADNYSGNVAIGKGITKKNDSTSTGSTTAFNPFLENDSIIAKDYIDMRDTTHRTIAVYCKLMNSTDSATIRMDIFDVNGRRTNYDNSSAKKGIRPSVDFQKLVFKWCNDSGYDPNNIGNWNEDATTFADGYSGDFWGVINGHWSLNATPGLPRVTYQGAGFPLNLDPAYMIPKFSFSTNGGSRIDPWVRAMATGTMDKEFDVLIQKVEFGVAIQSKFNAIPNVLFSKVKTTQTINLNSFFVADLPPVFTVDLVQGSHLSAIVSNGIVSLSQKDNFCSPFVEIVTAKTIVDGQVYTQPITVTQTDTVASPFTFTVIPEQTISDTAASLKVDLKQYISNASGVVKPVFTVISTEQAVSYSVDSTLKLVATINDKTWMGTALASITVQDPCGNKNTTTITYKRVPTLAPITALDAEIQTYPNPTKGAFSVSISSDVARDYSLELINTLGEKVFESKTGMIASKVIDVDASTLPSGIYQLMIISNDAVQIKQFVIAR